MKGLLKEWIMTIQHLKITHYIRWLTALAVLGLLGSSCTHVKPVPLSEGSSACTLNLPWKLTASNTSSQKSYSVIGRASWYGREFHRRRTSSGERFNMYAHTAAHRTLPFGSRLLVTNLSNGKSVIVRVNDRGPRSRKLVIDLSYGAARKIGMHQCMGVEVQLLSKGSASRMNNLTDSEDTFSIQAGSFESREKAETLLAELGKEFGPVSLVAEKGLYKVRVGAFEDPDQARTMKEDLTSKGYQVFTVKQTPDAIALAEIKQASSGSHD
jgi:rare lipoprotein A